MADVLLAVITPVTSDACSVVGSYPNRHLMDFGSAFFSLPAPQYAIRINLGLFFGRHCLDIGSSRANLIKLPPSADVGPRQFILTFDIPTLSLRLSTQEEGVQIHLSDHHLTLGPKPFTLPDQASIFFGDDQRYGFKIHSLGYSVDDQMQEALSCYAHSIGYRLLQSPLDSTLSTQCLPLSWTIRNDDRGAVVSPYSDDVSRDDSEVEDAGCPQPSGSEVNDTRCPKPSKKISATKRKASQGEKAQSMDRPSKIKKLHHVRHLTASSSETEQVGSAASISSTDISLAMDTSTAGSSIRVPSRKPCSGLSGRGMISYKN